jgi:hypothetical protein
MEPEGSLPHSQEPATCPYPEPYQSSPQRISPGPRLCIVFCNMVIFYGEELLAPRPTPKLEGHPLSAVRNCLFNVFAATLHIRRPFLHPQSEDAPCRGDRDPLIMARILKFTLNRASRCGHLLQRKELMDSHWIGYWVGRSGCDGETITVSSDSHNYNGYVTVAAIYRMFFGRLFVTGFILCEMSKRKRAHR